MSRLVRAGLLALTASLILALPQLGTADGDPASDVLYTRNVFVPFPPPSKTASEALSGAVAAAFAHRYRVKVAVIGSRTDLGSVPELFGKPAQYARFLGAELDLVFAGPLLIVMPAGFGVYDAGRSTGAEERVLSGLRVGGGSADELTRAAAAAIRKLTAARALRSRDIRAPVVIADPGTAVAGAKVKLRYTIIEDSQRSREIVRVWRKRWLLQVVRTGFRPAIPQRPHSVTLRVPERRFAGLRFCVVAADASGNRSHIACAPITVVA